MSLARAFTACSGSQPFVSLLLQNLSLVLSSPTKAGSLPQEDKRYLPYDNTGTHQNELDKFSALKRKDFFSRPPHPHSFCSHLESPVEECSFLHLVQFSLESSVEDFKARVVQNILKKWTIFTVNATENNDSYNVELPRFDKTSHKLL